MIRLTDDRKTHFEFLKGRNHIWTRMCLNAALNLTTDLTWGLKSGPHEEEQTDEAGSDSPHTLLGLDYLYEKYTHRVADHR